MRGLTRLHITSGLCPHYRFACLFRAILVFQPIRIWAGLYVYTYMGSPYAYGMDLSNFKFAGVFSLLVLRILDLT